MCACSLKILLARPIRFIASAGMFVVAVASLIAMATAVLEGKRALQESLGQLGGRRVVVEAGVSELDGQEAIGTVTTLSQEDVEVLRRALPRLVAVTEVLRPGPRSQFLASRCK